MKILGLLRLAPEGALLFQMVAPGDVTRGEAGVHRSPMRRCRKLRGAPTGRILTSIELTASAGRALLGMSPRETAEIVDDVGLTIRDVTIQGAS